MANDKNLQCRNTLGGKWEGVKHLRSNVFRKLYLSFKKCGNERRIFKKWSVIGPKIICSFLEDRKWKNRNGTDIF